MRIEAGFLFRCRRCDMSLVMGDGGGALACGDKVDGKCPTADDPSLMEVHKFVDPPEGCDASARVEFVSTIADMTGKS